MNRSNYKICNIQIFLFLILMMVHWDIRAQITKIKPVNINEGLKDSTIQVMVIPVIPADIIKKIFDGNPFTEAALPNSDSLILTLSFNNPVEISKIRIFFWNNGKWSLEIADTEEDLNNKSGSYQMLVQRAGFIYFQWDSLDFSPLKVKMARLSAWNQEYKSIYLGEWSLFTSFTLTALKISPDPIRLIPGASLQLRVNPVDDHRQIYPYDLPDPVGWSSDNSAVALVDDLGWISGVSLGSATISAVTPKLKGAAMAIVESDFVSSNATPLIKKVAVVLQDPIIDFTHNRRIHEVRSWENPMKYVYQLVDEFRQMSAGVVLYQLADVRNDQFIFSRLDGEFMTIDTIAYYYNSLSRLYGRDVPGTLQNLAETQHRVKFDYNAMIDYYDLDTKRNTGIIDEVWVYAHPFASMYESQLVGPGAFWYNSPPLDHPGLKKLLPIMGWNYERGMAEALESYGHRSESTMAEVYHGWNVHPENPTNWDIFTRIDKNFPGGAHVGNIHYPPNGMSDYDYANSRYVSTYADNWKRYPIILDQTRVINAAEWGFSHLGYMRWWYNHLPRYEGVTDSILNNWWHYIVDYEGAVALARQLITFAEDKADFSNLKPGDYLLEQNYPNPFNQLTQIRFHLPVRGYVTLKVYDILSREVKIMIDEWKEAGQYKLNFDGAGLTSGIYFYQLRANEFSETRKFLLLK